MMHLVSYFDRDIRFNKMSILRWSFESKTIKLTTIEAFLEWAARFVCFINGVTFGTTCNLRCLFFKSEAVELIATKTFFEWSTGCMSFELRKTIFAICCKWLLSYWLESKTIKLPTPSTFLKWPWGFIGKMLSIAFTTIRCKRHFNNK